MTRISLLVAVSFVLAGCGDAAAPSDSGVEGTVLIGPMCPVVQEGVPCPDEPFEATIDVRSADDGEIVATIRSGKDGRFRVNLAPGRYVLVPSPGGGGLPSAAEVPVTVRAHEFTSATVSYDSGIR